MEMMEEDEPLSSSEAPRAPTLDTEEGLSIPVAGPETPFRPTSGMPGLTPTGEHVTALQSGQEQVLRGLVCVCYELQARKVLFLIFSLHCFCNSLSVFYFKLVVKTGQFFNKKNKKQSPWGSPHTSPQALLFLPVYRVACHPDRQVRQSAEEP